MTVKRLPASSEVLQLNDSQLVYRSAAELWGEGCGMPQPTWLSRGTVKPGMGTNLLLSNALEGMLSSQWY